jgi:hypothetical protein
MEPFEFIVDGPPVSQQTRRHERLHEWKRIIRAALVYEDDLQVSDSVNRRRNLRGEYVVADLTPVLAEGFDRNREFLYVSVTTAPIQGGLAAP